MPNQEAPRNEGSIVRVEAGPVTLEGMLAVPEDARGIVLFAHGSGSSRHSPRNRYVAGELREAGLGTLLIDLLTSEEEAVDNRTREYRFDIGMLAERLVGAVVSRGGRPDLAGDTLPRVSAPTLLIVGGDDLPVIDMNQTAMERMDQTELVELEIVPGATHLFEEPGKLEEVARLARGWFVEWLSGA